MHLSFDRVARFTACIIERNEIEKVNLLVVQKVFLNDNDSLKHRARIGTEKADKRATAILHLHD